MCAHAFPSSHNNPSLWPPDSSVARTVAAVGHVWNSQRAHCSVIAILPGNNNRTREDARTAPSPKTTSTTTTTKHTQRSRRVRSVREACGVCLSAHRICCEKQLLLLAVMGFCSKNDACTAARWRFLCLHNWIAHSFRRNLIHGACMWPYAVRDAAMCKVQWPKVESPNYCSLKKYLKYCRFCKMN